jgi:hypothetical protein
MRCLWLQHTLLFIGCSADGLEDPDFIRFFNWAAAQFKGRPYKHYWLTKVGAAPFDEKVRWLLENRVQVIEYGSSYDDLPGFLATLCPDPDKVVEERVKYVQLALGAGTAEAVLSKVQSLRVVAQLAGTTERALQTGIEPLDGTADQRMARNARLKRELVDLQRLALELVNIDELRRYSRIGAAASPYSGNTPPAGSLEERTAFHGNCERSPKLPPPRSYCSLMNCLAHWIGEACEFTRPC